MKKDINIKTITKESMILNKKQKEAYKKSKELFTDLIKFIFHNRTKIVIALSIISLIINPILGSNVYAVSYITTITTQYEGIQKILNFLKSIIKLIQSICGTIAGLVVVVTGWQILTNSTSGTNGLETAKKNLKNAVVALFFIFAGTELADVCVSMMASTLGLN